MKTIKEYIVEARNSGPQFIVTKDTTDYNDKKALEQVKKYFNETVGYTNIKDNGMEYFEVIVTAEMMTRQEALDFLNEMKRDLKGFSVGIVS